MLDSNTLRTILKKFAPDVDADDDGIFQFKWTSTTTFYRQTEEYVKLEERLAYKYALEQAFPGKSAVL